LYGLKHYEAAENTLVILPAGVVHSNQNNGTAVQSSITLLLPEPATGASMGAGVQIIAPGGNPGGNRGGTPGAARDAGR
jgi:hypothetical protein